MILRLLLALLCATLVHGADRFDPVREFIRKNLTEVPSIAVAVAVDGKIIWEEGFGWAHRENRIAATEHTMYSLASISKPITATGLMILKERGKINLDKPINDYLGAAKLNARVGRSEDATVRRVANHTSGLPLHYQFFFVDEPVRPPTRDETIRRYGNLVTAPGERYEYSNLGFGILDHLITRVSGKDYADFMREEVFLPLGLTRTSVHIGPGLEKHAAVRYGTDGLPLPFYDFDHPGASAIYASAHDLVRFGMFHLKAHLPDQKAILTDAAIDEMQQPTAKTGPTSGYGIGWGTNENSGYRFVSHTGGMMGVTTVLRLVPSEKLAIVALCNARAALCGQVTNRITAVLLPKTADNTPTPLQGEPPAFKPTPEMIGTWKGSIHTWKGERPMTLWILPSGDVHARMDGQLRMLWNLVSSRDERLAGRMLGDLGTDDAARLPYFLNFTLKLRGSVLNGPVTAQSQPGRRSSNALTSFVELKKE